ncbi:hypothetical protein C8R45DRAFT_1085158 [Mycena sanguinolenta]|nr:hypothetical protein C8R45DRAFT_1085158 [Mycena sanguinolenta]
MAKAEYCWYHRSGWAITSPPARTGHVAVDTGFPTLASQCNMPSALQLLLRCDRRHRLVGDHGIAAKEGRLEGSRAPSASKALAATAARDAHSGQITTPGARPK